MVQTIAAPNDRTPEKPLPELVLPLDTLAFIIVKAREFDVKVADDDADSGSNPADDGQTDVLQDTAEDQVQEE